MEDNRFMELVASFLEDKPCIFWFLIGIAYMISVIFCSVYLAGLKVKEFSCAGFKTIRQGLVGIQVSGFTSREKG